ncbi:sugar O-acetyltransferase [Pasteurellaceae bacterium LIM206]|nr:sugar O-acetyltransferase [Pasteurellaceae bacterium LIM206]
MLTEKEKMLQGLAHLAAEPELRDMRMRTKERLFDFNMTRPSDKAEKERLLRTILAKAGKNPHINSPFACDYGSHIEVGDNFFANYNCVILDSGGVKIGNNVMFAPNVSLYTVGHPLDAELRNEGWEQAKPIIIGDNVWVGGNAVILPGVTIGDNVVIAAGAVVTKDIPANSLVAGNPARVLRPLTRADRDHYLQTFQPER